MKKILILILTVFVCMVAPNRNAVAQSMTDYCTTPPFIGQSVTPNVLITLDNSGSMYEFAYKDFQTSHSRGVPDTSNFWLCWDGYSWSPCECENIFTNGYYGYGTDCTDDSFDPNTVYYGYFNSNQQYSYSSTAGGHFYEDVSGDWNGNFLNWLTMRRVDVVRKVLVGGKAINRANPSSAKYLVGAEDTDRNQFKQIADASPYTPFSGQRCFYIANNASYEAIRVINSGSCADYFWNYSSNIAGTYTVKVKVGTEEPVGVVQSTWDKVRFGLMFFNKYGNKYEDGGGGNKDGGYISDWISGPGANVDLVVSVENTDPSTWTPLAESFYEATRFFRAGTGAYQNANYAAHDPIQYKCQKNFVLMLTDGESTKDRNIPGGYWGSTVSDPDGFDVKTYMDSIASNEGYSSQWNEDANNMDGTYYLEGVAYWAHTNDLRSDWDGTQDLTIYTVFAFDESPVGRELLQKAAKYGGFRDFNGNNIPDLNSEWDEDNDSIPDTYFEAQDGAELEQDLTRAIADILKKVSSGTAASVLASGEGSGANLLQAVFYATRKFDDNEVAWTGRLTNLWYYIDPFFTNSSIYEDNTSSGVLDLTDDNKVIFYFDPDAEQTMAERSYDSDGDGIADTTITPDIELEKLTSLWEAGKLLWSRDISTNARTIKTSVGSGLIDFSTANKTALQPYLLASDEKEAEAIIRYIHGEDTLSGGGFNPPITGFAPTYRSRTVTIDGEGPKVWKLGDILNSTPRISSWIQLNNYDTAYNDATYKSFLETSGYTGRGMVFAGANDGMLHAFKLGKLELTWTGKGQYQKARLTETDLGEEIWAFIPKNVLPYLKYLTDPSYCHVYTVDLSPYLFDASINGNPEDTRTVNSWRTILIGGMRTGGACRDTASPCSDCVKTPVSGLGYSSYFAIDITDSNHNNWTFLWEFSHEDLGFAATGPAVVRISTKDGDDNPEKDTNGKWFVVFGSGPTGPISMTDQQFLGRSDQNLKFFILDLKTGNLVSTPIDTGIENAFAGSMLYSTHDTDLDYQDNAIYVPYVKKANNNKWTDGGVIRLLTKEDTSPSAWEWSKVIDGIGPVTSSVVRLQHKTKGQLWLYFGTGRYYFKQGANIDDAAGQRQIFGIKEPCFSLSGFSNCGGTQLTFCSNPTSATTCGDLKNVTDIADIPADPDDPLFKGWYINLEAQGVPEPEYDAERAITDPLASTTGVAFFTTFKPSLDICAYGGQTYVWAVRYNTGGNSALKGKALIQVSTGSIEQIDLTDDLTEKDGRRTGSFEGKPPGGPGLLVITPPSPVKRVVHIRGR